MFAVALVAPKWPIFKKHITSWHDLVVFSIGMEFVAYLGNHNNGQCWPNMVPTMGTDSSTRTPCKAGVILSPSYQRKRRHNFTCLPVSESLIPRPHWASLLPKALSATQIHSRQRCHQQSPGNLGSRIEILWSPFSPDKRTILRKPARRTANNKNIP